MATDDSTTSDKKLAAIIEAETRSKALKRSWVCPGAGFALVGSAAFAIAALVASLCPLPALAWLAFRPTAASLWTALAILAISLVLWIVEQIAVKRMPIRASAPAILVRGFAACTCVTGLAGLLGIGLLVTAFGSLRMAGSGMMPTLEPAERLIYHKHVDWHDVKPGAIIVYRNAADSAWGEPGWIVISRILAGPGDKMSIDNARYIVNGIVGPAVAVTGEYDVVLNIPSSPESLTVPDDCYFAVQDSPSGGFDSRVLSWVRAENIIGSRLWRFSSRAICSRVQ